MGDWQGLQLEEIEASTMEEIAIIQVALTHNL